MRIAVKTYLDKIIEKIVKFCNKLNEHHMLWIISFAIIYKFLLDISYIFIISPIFSYQGMTLEPSALKYLLSTFLYFFLFCVMPKNENDFAAYFLNLQFVVMLAPMLCLYALQSRNNTTYVIIVCVCVLLQIIILKRKTTENNRVTVYIKDAKCYTIVFLILFIAFCGIVPILYNGFAGIKAFDFSYIYKMRSSADYPPLFGYFLPWVTRAIIPFFIVYSLTKRKYFYSILLCTTQLIFYMAIGEKVMFLILPVIIGVFIFARLNILTKGMYFTLASGCLVTTVMALLEKSTQVLWINAFWGHRFLFIPAQIKFQFYEVFSQYPNLFFGDGLIGHLFSLPYIFANSTGRVVFAYYNEGSFGAQSNTGYWGDSYAQMGFCGIVLMSILLAYIIKFIDNSTTNLGFASLAGVFSVPIVQLNDGALFTIILTGGMLVLLFLVFIFNEPPDSDKNRFRRGTYYDNCV